MSPWASIRFKPFGGLTREQLRVVKGKDTLFVWCDEDGTTTGTSGRAT